MRAAVRRKGIARAQSTTTGEAGAKRGFRRSKPKPNQAKAGHAKPRQTPSGANPRPPFSIPFYSISFYSIPSARAGARVGPRHARRGPTPKRARAPQVARRQSAQPTARPQILERQGNDGDKERGQKTSLFLILTCENAFLESVLGHGKVMHGNEQGEQIRNDPLKASKREANRQANAKQTRIKFESNRYQRRIGPRARRGPAGRITHKAAHGGVARPAFPRPLFRQARAAASQATKPPMPPAKAPGGSFPAARKATQSHQGRITPANL